MSLLEMAKKAQKKPEKNPDTPKKPAAKKKPAPKKTTPKKRDSTFDFKEHPVIILLWGQDGTSKSEQVMKFDPKENTIIIDLEDKLRPLAYKLNFPQENIITGKQYNERFNIDGPKTLEDVRDIINQIKTCKINNEGRFKDVRAVSIDGISDIRPYAEIEWLEENPSRKRPNTPGDWKEINDKVRDIIFSMINMGLVTKTNIFLTAQAKIRDQDVIPDVKPWISHNVHHKFKMTRDDTNQRFYAYCEKSHFDPFWSIDLTDFTHEDVPSLMNILQDPEAIKEYQTKFREQQRELATSKANSML